MAWRQFERGHPERAYQREVYRLLGDFTPEELLELPEPDQERNLFRSQVTEEYVVIKEGDEGNWFNEEIKNHFLLRDAELVAPGELGRRIARKASHVHYANNMFYVDLDWLGEFLGQCRSDNAVSEVRRIIVNVPISSLEDADFEEEDDIVEDIPYGLDNMQSENFDLNYWEKKGRQLPPVVRDLRQLSRLTSAERILIYVVGGGAPNGSDLNSHLKIRQICRVVKRLLSLFGKRLRIWKVLQFSDQSIQNTEALVGQDITDYWAEPTADVKARVVDGQATFRDIMQVQIGDWARCVPRLVGPDAHRMILM